MACAAREVPMARWKHNFGPRTVLAELAPDNRSNGSGNERRPDDLRFVSTAFRRWLLPQVALTNSCQWDLRNRQPGRRTRRRFALRNRPDTCCEVGASLFRTRSHGRAVRLAHDTIARPQLPSSRPAYCNKH